MRNEEGKKNFLILVLRDEMTIKIFNIKDDGGF